MLTNDRLLYKYLIMVNNIKVTLLKIYKNFNTALMITNPIRNLSQVRSVLNDKGQVEEKLVTGLGPQDSFSN